ncbi:MAG: hypothetical protein ABSC05_23465 [Candidatus Solibacter sp.]
MLRIRNWCANFETHESRKLKRLDWVSVPKDILDLQYRLLVDHPDGAAHFAAWIVIVEIASTCKVRGTLQEGGVSLSTRHLALKSGLPLALFESAIPRLMDTGWLEEISDTGEFSTTMPGENPGGTADFRQDAGKSSAYIDTNSNKDNKHICASDDAPVGDAPLSVTLFPVIGTALEKPAKSADGLTAEQDGWFSQWWGAFWTHKGKKKARQLFARKVKTVGLFEDIMTATTQQAPAEFAKDAQYRCHPSTYLSQERWEDETAAPGRKEPVRLLA